MVEIDAISLFIFGTGFFWEASIALYFSKQKQNSCHCHWTNCSHSRSRKHEDHPPVTLSREHRSNDLTEIHHYHKSTEKAYAAFEKLCEEKHNSILAESPYKMDNIYAMIGRLYVERHSKTDIREYIYHRHHSSQEANPTARVSRNLKMGYLPPRKS